MHVHVFNSESRKEALLQITVRLDGKTKCSSRVHAFVVPSFSHFAFVPVRGRGGGQYSIVCLDSAGLGVHLCRPLGDVSSMFFSSTFPH